MSVRPSAVDNAIHRHLQPIPDTWTPDRIRQLRELRIAGVPYAEIAERMGLSRDAVEGAGKRYRISGAMLEANHEIPIFNGDLKLPMDAYLVTCDYHSPYYSVLWHNRSLAIAEKYGLKKLIVVGDLVDFAFASHWYSDNRPGLADEAAENKRLIQSLLAQFEEIVVIKGNHENRLGRRTDGVIQARYLFELWAGDEYGKRFKYSLYDKLTVGNEWLLVHPQSYSQISGQVARKLAAKLHKNVLNTHGHFLSYGYDVSGRYIAADIGGMFDKDKVEYKNIKTTIHPEWNSGFAMLRSGHLTLFDENSDWGALLDDADLSQAGKGGNRAG